MLIALPIVLSLVMPQEPAKGPPESSPDRPAVVAGALGKRLDSALRTCEAFGFHGVVLVQRKGKPILRKGYGFARPGVPHTPETLYDIASVSKQVTAAAILALEADGRLRLDDSIAEHLPAVADRDREVTLRHLLQHTSGWPRSAPAAGFEREAAVALNLARPRRGPAGARFEYDNAGYALLAAVVETASGQRFEDYVRERLFARAGLLQTDFIETARVDPTRFATNRSGTRRTIDYIKGWGYRGAGGVLTSVCDLGLWIDALQGDAVLPPRQREAMFTPGLESYGLGWYVLDLPGVGRCVQHSGGAGAFATYVRHFVDRDTLVIVCSNRPAIHWQVTYWLCHLAVGSEAKVTPPPRLVSWSARQRERVVGRWQAGGDVLELQSSAGGFLVDGAGPRVAVALAAKVDEDAAVAKRLAMLSARALAVVEDVAAGGFRPARRAFVAAYSAWVAGDGGDAVLAGACGGVGGTACHRGARRGPRSGQWSRSSVDPAGS